MKPVLILQASMRELAMEINTMSERIGPLERQKKI